MRELPYRRIRNGRAGVDERVLVAEFADAEVECELANDERFCILTHRDVSWTVVNSDRLSTVTADETGGGFRIVRVIDRTLTPSELLVFNEVLARYGCP